ncbi:DUF362 domain-containing protein [Candidatus Sumerlaeota bacterium]|nr:DUF362 domain-containing protein [Candidatus Sumerlaeota bacterium]
MNDLREDEKTISRRKFLIRMMKAGASITAAGALAAFLHDKKAPSGYAGGEVVQIPDFSLEKDARSLAIVSGENRKLTLEKAIDALGGIGRFIKKGDRVLIKVNAAFATPPVLCATTHPDLVREMIALCLKAGASEARVTDNPINDPASCFLLTGIREATESSGGKLILPKSEYFKHTTLINGNLIRDWPVLYAPFDGVTKLIGMAPLKDHHRSGASMTMKNWYGLLGGRRNIFHQDIHNIIKELAMMVKPTLAILDGTNAMMTNGPTGGSLSDLKATNMLIAGTDSVAIDAFGSALLERRLSDLPFIQKAADMGVGTADYESLKPVRITIN